jgi:hypothetical protein
MYHIRFCNLVVNASPYTFYTVTTFINVNNKLSSSTTTLSLSSMSRKYVLNILNINIYWLKDKISTFHAGGGFNVLLVFAAVPEYMRLSIPASLVLLHKYFSYGSWNLTWTLVSIMFLCTWHFASRFGQSCQSHFSWLSQIGNSQLVLCEASTVFELGAWSWNL